LFHTSFPQLLYFQPDGKHLANPIGRTLLEAAQELGVEISAVCGGVGTCGKCKVLVKDGASLLDPPTRSEKSFFRDDEIDVGYRLGCEAVMRVDGLLTVEVPVESRGGRHRLQSEGLETRVDLDAAVKSVRFVAKAPTVDSPSSLFETMKSALGDQGVKIDSVDHECLTRLGTTLSEHRWQGSALIYNGHKLIAISEESVPLLGVAVDIGTTKLAAYLSDLKSGQLLSKVTRVNPQVLYGEDVMSRLAYVQHEKDGLRRLIQSIREGVNEMIQELCLAADVRPDWVRNIVLVGNTLMHHLFIGLQPSTLGVSPYTPVIASSYDIEGRAIEINGGTGLMAYLLPNVAGFVGADCIGDVIATELHKPGGSRLLIDIGTNTEIVCASDTGLWCASAPSGPTFEGAHISSGMRALTGAIEHVSIDNSLSCKYSTVDGTKARGICGSGVVDLVSEMRKRGIIESSGRFSNNKTTPRLVRDQNGSRYTVSPNSENAIGRDITFTQGDVREIQKAKAAISSGIRILLQHAKVSVRDLQSVYIAGAFGSYIDVASAISIGMIPITPLYKIRQVGNAAGTGARMCLLSSESRRRAEDVARRMSYVELAAQSDFQKIYLGSLEISPFS
jgi:uncharacterized 2Fe-2S/4Fe-4S cluster protein (DUF4445 family)